MIWRRLAFSSLFSNLLDALKQIRQRRRKICTLVHGSPQIRMQISRYVRLSVFSVEASLVQFTHRVCRRS